MSGYSFTERGQEMAEKLNLPELGERLSAAQFEYGMDAVTEHLVKSYSSLYRCQEDIDDCVINTAKLLLSSDEEYRVFSHGLSLNNSDSWKMNDQLDEDGRLFPIPKYFKAANKVDSFVLSGLYGLQYRHRHALRSILSKEGYANTDFKSRVEASAFVGAFILTKIAEDYDSWLSLSGSGEPNFSYEDGSTEKTLIVKGTLHGDLRVLEKTSLKTGAISPLGQAVDYSPVVSKVVAGYHSVEVELTVAMLEHALIAGGKDSLTSLNNEFVEAVSGELGEGPRISMFGDYGSSSARHSMYLLQGLLDGEGGTPRVVHSSPYLPQSDYFMEILLEDQGIVLRNRDVKKDIVENSIMVKSDNFKNFFGLLIDQANQGLGRTSVGNHLEVLARTDAIIRDEEFVGDQY